MRLPSCARQVRQAWNSPIAFSVILSLLSAPPVLAQQLAAPVPAVSSEFAAAAQAASAPMALHIVILEGEGALNNVRQRTAREPIVQVQDQNHKPVAGALVLFSIHGGASGAGAVFPNAATTLTVTTDAAGRAVASGLQINQAPGTYTISVQASFGGLTAEATIHQTDTSTAEQESEVTEPSAQPAGKSGRSLLKRIATRPAVLIGAAVAVTILTVVLTTRSKGTTITAGSATVGP